MVSSRDKKVILELLIYCKKSLFENYFKVLEEVLFVCNFYKNVKKFLV